MDFASLVSGFLQWSEYVIVNFGYAGVFLVGFVTSASIFLPVPGFLFILAAGPFLNPWLLGIVAGAGMAVGELTGYAIGKGGRRTVDKVRKNDRKWLKKGERWFRKGRGFLFIVLFAATPLPDDITGIVGGLFSYDWRKFLLASFIGKTCINLLLAFAGHYGIGMILGLFGLNL